MVLSLPEPADAAEGVALVVDGGEPMRIPYEFLEARAGGRAIAIRPEVADIVLDALKKGRRLEWRYTRKGGAARAVTFDIACLGAEGLFSAAEKRLATMRAMKQLGKSRSWGNRVGAVRPHGRGTRGYRISASMSPAE